MENKSSKNSALSLPTEKTQLLSTLLVKPLLASLFIAISAQISIPMWPVPMTMQTVAIMIIALYSSPVVATNAVLFYILEGAMGLPVFQGFANGIHTIIGTTGGYIIGFLPMAFLISWLKDYATNMPYRFAVCVIGQIALYALGITWLSQFVGFESAIHLGLMPFALKIPVAILFALASKDIIKGLSKRLSN